MGKGSEDANPVGTKTGGWIKCADGYWHTESAAAGKTFSKSVGKKIETVTVTATPAATAASADKTAKK
jgi:hypothetical protein